MVTLLEARTAYFEANGFGEDGGYSKPTVTVYLFGLPVSFPNTESRKRAVVFHDMHHVTTGYATHNLGEAEIGAWELGSGCRDYYAAWVLNTTGLLLGLFKNPARVFRAFVRGRQTKNLYGRDSQALLGTELETVRAQMGLDAPLRPASLADAVSFAFFASIALLVASVPLLLVTWLLVSFS